MRSHTPYPYQLCYCTICRKTAGGGGFAINLMGDVSTLKVKGRRSVGIYRATIREDDGGNCTVSTGERNYCRRCATALWLFDPERPDLMHPFASAVDTPLPLPQGNRVSLCVTSRAKAESVGVLLIRGGQLDGSGRDAGGARVRSSR